MIWKRGVECWISAETRVQIEADEKQRAEDRRQREIEAAGQAAGVDGSLSELPLNALGAHEPTVANR